METKGIINKISFLFFGLFLFYGISVSQVVGQSKAAAGAFVMINRTSNASPINSINIFSLNGTAVKSVSGNTILISSENSKLMNSVVQNLGSFSITGQNKNSFSVSLPAHPVMLTNSENGSTLQVTGWQSSSQSGLGEFKKYIRVVNLDGSLKIGTVNTDKSGVYSGTFPITFVYN